MESDAPFSKTQIFGRLRFRLFLAACTTIFAAQIAHGYVLNGKTWPTNTNIVFQLSLGSASSTLSDGNTSWNAAVLPVLNMWNSQMQRVQLSAVMDSTAPSASGDHVNSVVFANSVYGQSFGTGTLAVTYYYTQGTAMIEADVLFNRAQTFDSYRGSLKFGSNGYAIADIRRVFLHELGHGIGLQHQTGDVIMNPTISDREVLANDDIAGAQAMYGAPVATPTPTPSPTPDPSTPRLANISTRMKVGTGDQVLIGGFIINGSTSKQLLLRASGPSLAASGLSGAMQDPVLELHDSAGNIIAQNDDWQSGTQAAAISASGLAPNNPAEPAIIVTLQPGSYTAIVKGKNNTQGIALVEAYEFTAPNTRLANLSTRGPIGTGDEVLIGGFIVQGSGNKNVIICGLGPSLAGSVAGTLVDPTLDIYNSNGQIIASNDNWSTSPQKAQISATGLAPNNSLESAVIVSLAPGNYTAMVHGVNNTSGVGMVAVFDLDP
ncbi:MAG: M10 family metallopeptidase domain-containing protein [Verrucomicrobiota bacterium]|nr:M10 family metallopeptidase domain-containing protein [Verrucomicrobiota bacterium]